MGKLLTLAHAKHAESPESEHRIRAKPLRVVAPRQAPDAFAIELAQRLREVADFARDGADEHRDHRALQVIANALDEASATCSELVQATFF